jgi:hypothetical protein
MTRDEAKAELERIATEAPYERDRIQAIRLLREIWAEEDVDPQTRMRNCSPRWLSGSERTSAGGVRGAGSSTVAPGARPRGGRGAGLRRPGVLGLWDGPDYGPGWERLVEIAEEADAGYYVALDLYAEVSNPGSVSRYGGAEELRRRVAGC